MDNLNKENPKKELDEFELIGNRIKDSNKRFGDDELSKISSDVSRVSNMSKAYFKRETFSPLEVKGITGGVDYSKVEEVLGENYNIFTGEVQRDLGTHQSGWSQFGGFLNQAIVGEIVGGTIETVGRLLDIEKTIQLYKGDIEEFDNSLTELGFSLKEWAGEVTPIFGADVMWSSGWWAKGMVSTASSLSMLIPAIGSVKALGVLGRGLGILKNVENLTKAGRAAMAVRVGVSQAVLSRHMENWLEARDTWDSTLNEYVNERGFNLEDAELKASKAVRTNYILNSAMLAQDIFQYMTIGTKLFGTAAATKRLASAAGKSLPSYFAGKYKNLAINMLSEGFEEGYQYWASKQSLRTQLYKDGLTETEYEDISTYVNDDEFLTSVIFGALGAGVHQTVGSSFNKIMYSKDLKTNEDKRIENIKKIITTNNNLKEKLIAAQLSNNQEAVEDVLHEITINNALNSYEFGNSELAYETLGLMSETSNEELAKMGLDEDGFDNFRSNIKKAQDQTKDVFKRLKKNSKLYNDETLKSITSTEIALERLLEKNENHDKTIDELKNNSVTYKNLSPQERSLYDNKLLIDYNNNLIEQYKDKLNDGKLTDQHKKELEELIGFHEGLSKKAKQENKDIISKELQESPEVSLSDGALKFLGSYFDVNFDSISDELKTRRKDYKNKQGRDNKLLKVLSKPVISDTVDIGKALTSKLINLNNIEATEETLQFLTSKEYQKNVEKLKEQVLNAKKKAVKEAKRKEEEEKANAKNRTKTKEKEEELENNTPSTKEEKENELTVAENEALSEEDRELKSVIEAVEFATSDEGLLKGVDKNILIDLYAEVLKENENGNFSDLELDAAMYLNSLIEGGKSTQEGFDFGEISIFALNNSRQKSNGFGLAKKSIQEKQEKARKEAEESFNKKEEAKKQSINANKDNSNITTTTSTLTANDAVEESSIYPNTVTVGERQNKVSVEPTSLAWVSTSAMDNNEENQDMVELTLFLEDPNIDITEYSAEFEIDFNNDKVAFSQNELDTFNKEAKTQKQINNVPVKIYFVNKKTGERVIGKHGKELYSYLHQDNFWDNKIIDSVNVEDIKKDLAQFKYKIIQKTLNGEQSFSSFLGQNKGHLQKETTTITDDNGQEKTILVFSNISEALEGFTDNLDNVKILMGDRNNKYISDKSTKDEEAEQFGSATPGAIYIKFKRPDGSVFPARVFLRRFEASESEVFFEVYKLMLEDSSVFNDKFESVLGKNQQLKQLFDKSVLVKSMFDFLSINNKNITTIQLLSSLIFEGNITKGKSVNELYTTKNGDLVINGKKFNIKDFQNKKKEIIEEFEKKYFNVKPEFISNNSYKQVLIDNNLIYTQIRMKKGYKSPFSTPTTVISDKLEGDETNQSSGVEQRFDDETVTNVDTKVLEQIEADRKAELKEVFGNNVELIASKNETVIQRNGLWGVNGKDYKPQNVPTTQIFEQFDKINAKYDSQIKALKQADNKTTVNTETVAQIESGKEVELEKRREEVRELYKTNPILALHIIEKEKQIGSYDSYGRPHGEVQDIVKVLEVSIPEAQKLQQDYLKAGKPKGWKLGDEYDYSKYDSELEALKQVETKDGISTNPVKDFNSKDLEEINNELEKDEDVDEFDDFVFSTRQIIQKTDNDKLNEAIEVLKSILPKEIAITLQEDLIKIFENGDAAVASFSKAGIVLSSFANNKDAFHEAFHAVFRLLLSGKERNSLIENSKNGFLEPTDEQIKTLMDRHNLSKQEATDLYYEEILADEFGQYMSNPNTYNFNNKEQKSFFEKLLSWVNNILGIKSNREKLFSSIRKGDYSNRKQAKDSLINLNVNSTELAMFNNEVNYMLKAVEILQSDKAKQIFAKAEKNNWDLNKTLTELQIPKQQKQLLLDLGIADREQLALELASKYSFAVEINTAREQSGLRKDNSEFEANGVYYYSSPSRGVYKILYSEEDGGGSKTITREEFENARQDAKPTQHYSNLSAPSDTKFKSKYVGNPDWVYNELEFKTPLITPSIKGHAQFATDNGIGWARIWYNKKTGAVEIQEVQSDLFQKGRNKQSLAGYNSDLSFEEDQSYNEHLLKTGQITQEEFDNPKIIGKDRDNQFLQLLNKDNNWVTFFIKAVVQDSAKKGYKKVLFPTGNTASKVEGHTTLEEFKKQKEDRIKDLEEELQNNFAVVEIDNDLSFDRTIKSFKTEEEALEYSENLPYSEYSGELDIVSIKHGEGINKEINQLKQELERVDGPEGFAALKPIYNFYENTVTNILNKIYGKENVKVITDEHGNTWNEVVVNQVRDLSPIVFKTRVVSEKELNNKLLKSEGQFNSDGTKKLYPTNIANINKVNAISSRLNNKYKTHSFSVAKTERIFMKENGVKIAKKYITITVESKESINMFKEYENLKALKRENPLAAFQFNSLSLEEQKVLLNQTKYC